MDKTRAFHERLSSETRPEHRISSPSDTHNHQFIHVSMQAPIHAANSPYAIQVSHWSTINAALQQKWLASMSNVFRKKSAERIAISSPRPSVRCEMKRAGNEM